MRFKNKIKDIITNFKKIIKRPEMAILPGQLAYSFMLSFVPIVTLIGYAALFFNLPMNFLSGFLEKAFSKDIVSLISPIIDSTAFNFQFLFVVIVGFYIASNGCKSLIITSNAIYNIENEGKIKMRTKSIFMTLIIVILFIFLLIVPVFGNKIIELIKYVKTDQIVVDNVGQIFVFLKGPITWLFLFVFIKIIYTMAPDKRIPSSSVNCGSIFTTILWALTTTIYSYYATHFARYDLLFGNLSNLVVLMLWLYLLAYIFVIGLALNNIEEQKLEKTGVIKKLD